MIVCKFGGTSVAGFKSSKKIKEIIDSNNNRNIVVVSALGKSEKYNEKITDKLYELYNTYINGEDFLPLVGYIFKRYEELSSYLKVNINWNSHKQYLISDLNDEKLSKSYLVSRGEYYSAQIYSRFLNATFLDASNYIFFNKNGSVNYTKTRKALLKLNNKTRYVIGGFYGSYPSGDVCVFDRGGSDITGAVISKCLNAEVYENYTDVNGVYNKNPNIFNNAKAIPILSFKTAIQMAEAGNEIVHKNALLSLKNTQTILLIKNTNHYNNLGTIVVDNGLISNELYVCVDKAIAVISKKINQDIANKIKETSDIKNIYNKNKKYIAIIKNNIKPINYYKITEDMLIDYCYVIKMFSNIIILKKYIKVINKIKNKVKNYSLFCDFCAVNNNFTIICNAKYYGLVLKIINQCLQTK